MIKVFLAEDESVVREGLRDSIPWAQYGFTFAGEAADGEMALPLIQKTKQGHRPAQGIFRLRRLQLRPAGHPAGRGAVSAQARDQGHDARGA